MAIIYVSKNGLDSNSGATLALAKRTLAGANAAAVDGDIILFDDGVYTGSEIESSGGLGYFLNIKGVKLDSINPYGATLNAAAVTALFRNNGAFANKTLSFGKIVLCDGGTEPNYAVWFAPTSGPATLDLGDVKIKSSIFYGVNVNSANTVQVHVIDDGSEITASRSAIDAINLGNNSTVTLNRTTVNIQNKLVARGAINIKATTTGCSAQILEPVITVAHDATFPVQADFGIVVYNIDNALIYKPTITMTTASASGTSNGAVIDCDSGTLTAHYGKIIGGSISVNCNGGIGALIGHDATGGAGDNRCNFGLLRGITVTGGDKFQLGGGHGVMLGNCQDAFAAGNTVYKAGIGCLLKGTTRGRFNANRAVDCSLSYTQLKGCTDSLSDGNEFNLDNSAGIAIVANDNGGVNNTGCSVQGNVFKVTSGWTGQFVVSINPSQSVSLARNVYNILATAAVPNPICSVLGTTYATLSAYKTAVEQTSEIIDDRVIPSSVSGVMIGELTIEVAPGINLAL